MHPLLFVAHFLVVTLADAFDAFTSSDSANSSPPPQAGPPAESSPPPSPPTQAAEEEESEGEASGGPSQLSPRDQQQQSSSQRLPLASLTPEPGQPLNLTRARLECLENIPPPSPLPMFCPKCIEEHRRQSFREFTLARFLTVSRLLKHPSKLKLDLNRLIKVTYSCGVFRCLHLEHHPIRALPKSFFKRCRKLCGIFKISRGC